MTDSEILAIIAQGIVDGTDLDCTPETQAREVLRQLREAGVIGKPTVRYGELMSLANELSWSKKTRPISERIRACLEAPQCPQ